MSLRIREFSPEDYPAVVAVGNAANPDYPRTEPEWRHEDAMHDPKLRRRRWLAEWDGRVAGFGGYHQNPWQYHPQKFTVFVAVRPEFRRRGIGGALYEHTLAALAEYDPIQLKAHARENDPDSVRFLNRHGFVEQMRDWESRLEVAAFDPAPFAGRVERVLGQGIAIRTCAELENDPARFRKLHTLEGAVEDDMPAAEPVTHSSFEAWERRVTRSPGFLPDAWSVAVDGSEYVGLTQFWASQASPVLYTGATGVRREYRRRGIALALKLRAVEYARRRGAPELRTWNEVGNEGMLSINIRLGFRRHTAAIGFVNELREEGT